MVYENDLRMEERVNVMRSSSLNMAGVTKDFEDNFNKINGYLASKLAKSTDGRYLSSFKKFEQFCTEKNVLSLPSHPEVIMTYFIKISEKSKSVSSVLTARSAIKRFNLLYSPNVKSPTDSSDVKDMVDSISRKYAKPVIKSQPTQKEFLNKMIDKYLCGDHLRNGDFKIGIDKWEVVAKSVVKFHCFARFEEAIHLKKSDFEFLANGDIRINFLKGKVTQLHQANKNVIAASNDFYCPVNIIKKYFLRINSVIDHYFIPKIENGFVCLRMPAPYDYCLNQLRKALKEIGVQDWKKFGEHSDRCGGISAAVNAGVDMSSVQVHARMKSAETVKMYYKQNQQNERNISNVLNRI